MTIPMPTSKTRKQSTTAMGHVMDFTEIESVASEESKTDNLESQSDINPRGRLRAQTLAY
jgi:hypothetical protein